MQQIPFRGFGSSPLIEQGRARVQAYFNTIQASYPEVCPLAWGSVATLVEMAFVLGRQEQTKAHQEALAGMVKYMERVKQEGPPCQPPASGL